MFPSFFLSFDSFVASLALGLLMMAPQRKFQTCILFGLYDGLATLAGLHLQYGSAFSLGSDQLWIVPAGICAWILFVAFLIHRIVVRKPTSTLVISLVPLVMSLDNLCAGGVFSKSSLPANNVVVAALLSMSLSVAGFAIAALLQNRMPKSIAIVLGATLIFLTPLLF